jgi:hypothetical protein
MWDKEYLFRALPKLIDLILECYFFDRVLLLLDVDHAFISQMEEQVVSLNGLLSPLLVPENEVNPLVQIF